MRAEYSAQRRNLRQWLRKNFKRCAISRVGITGTFGDLMIDDVHAVRDRRALLKNGLALAGVLTVSGTSSAAQRMVAAGPVPLVPPAMIRTTVPAQPVVSPRVVRPDLLRRAMGALDAHAGRIARRDRIAIVDFAAGSSQARFHFVNVGDGRSTSFLVSHGSGSDPSHTGYLKRFSNDFGSNASSEGAFLADDYYVGKHGRSQRLIGLDPTNCNALGRALVVHSAWYANKDMLTTHGMLGRSQGCFAVGEADLDAVFERLGAGRMIYAAKLA